MTVIAWDEENLPVTDYQAEDLYEAYVDEIYEPTRIGGIEYEAGRILRAVDPIAFRVGMMAWVDNLVNDGIWKEA